MKKQWLPHWLQGRLQVHRAMGRLTLQDVDSCRNARYILCSNPLLAQAPLRRAAFRQSSGLAIEAALLLLQMRDVQGLYALMSQTTDAHLVRWHRGRLLHALQEAGRERITDLLEECLLLAENGQVQPLTDHWAMPLAVYALTSLQFMNAFPGSTLMQRALCIHHEQEGMRLCRAMLPTCDSAPSADWQHSGTWFAIRMAAVETLAASHSEEALLLLGNALQRPQLPVQYTALYGLYRLKTSRGRKLLQPLLTDSRHPLYRDALQLLEWLGGNVTDALTLVRPSSDALPVHEALLRPARQSAEETENELLHPVQTERKET